MSTPLHIVDAFTDAPFTGNPAGVCLLDHPRDATWMAAVAAELNLSETAFLQVGDTPGGTIGLRWFTPAVEVDLCGHATLASAHVLWQQGLVAPGTPIAFDTRSGTLGASEEADWIELDFPAEPATMIDPPAGLLESLGVRAVGVARNRLDYLVEVEDPAAVLACTPDPRRLAAVDIRGVIVTAAGGEHDFVSRYFAPAVGIDEDPVTGSAHCALGPYWSARLGRAEMVGHQVSARGGLVRVRCDDDRVRLGGRATTVVSGTLHP